MLRQIANLCRMQRRVASTRILQNLDAFFEVSQLLSHNTNLPLALSGRWKWREAESAVGIGHRCHMERNFE